jgi:hypothetical protein
MSEHEHPWPPIPERLSVERVDELHKPEHEQDDRRWPELVAYVDKRMEAAFLNTGVADGELELWPCPACVADDVAESMPDPAKLLRALLVARLIGK